jgi:hypothetical protein
MNNVRFDFWFAGKGKHWPRDTSSHVFLGRAVDVIGKSMFGSDWGGPVDIILEYEPTFPWRPGARFPGDANRAHDLLAHHRPEFGRKRLKGSKATELSEEEWRAAEETVAKINKDNAPGIQRFEKVKREVIQQSEAGKLVTAVRPMAGGEFREIPPWWWNSEKIDVRFQMCQLNPGEPFGYGFAGNGFCWIFVIRASLDAYIGSLAPQVKQTVAVQHQCQQWLEQQFSRQEAEGWNKRQFQAAATEIFGSALSVRMFYRAWDTAVAKPGNELRRRAGAKPKLT